MSILASGEFWAFVGVMAGIYTLLTLGLQVQFGLAGLLNFGQVGFMAIGAYTMAILVAKEGWSMWLATPLAIGAAALAGVLVGLPTLRLRGDYFAIVTIAFGEIVRYVALNEEDLTGGPQGTLDIGGPDAPASYNDDWLAFQGTVQDALSSVFGDVTKDVTMLAIVWTVAIVLIGLRVPLSRFRELGLETLVLTVVALAVGLGATLALARLLGVPRRLATLLALGTAGCGNTAIVAAAPIIRARRDEIAYAVAAITTFGTAAVLVFPPLGHALGLGDTEFGIWAGLGLVAGIPLAALTWLAVGLVVADA